MWDVESDARWSVDLASDPRGDKPLRIEASSDPAAIAAAESAVKRMSDFAIYSEAFLRDVVAGRVSVASKKPQGK
jgi:hypothetical protein